MKNNAIIDIKPLGFMWPVRNPFLFFAHHRDIYPAGNEKMGPSVSLEGRNIGNDFSIKDGWRMYHGDVVPGFPVHPHRGFETITIVLEGFVDHSDSHKQAGRYGAGDVQWMTAGSGLQHSEMFPLLNLDKENPAELFQIWLNLPKEKKFAEPHFKMLWSEDIPVFKTMDENGKSVSVKVIAGNIENVNALSSAPDSWAAMPENEVAVWIIKCNEGSKWNIPIAGEGVNRTVYFYKGNSLLVNGNKVFSGNAFDLKANDSVLIEAIESEAYMILLQGKPILEPIAQYGPFVMNTQAEIQQAIDDFRHTGFGGWPWQSNSQVYPRTKGRFALYMDGREEIR
jgi:redox-sensitive bicupin YhaK (pirin superfamily)